MPPVKFRPREVELAGLQWLPGDRVKADEAFAWLRRQGLEPWTDVWTGGDVVIVWDEDASNGYARPGEWIMRGITGKFFGVPETDHARDYLEVAA